MISCIACTNNRQVVADAVLKIVKQTPPGDSKIGLIISSCSCVMMGVMYLLKKRASVVLGSAILEQDAMCSRMCMMLSTIVILSTGIWLFRADINKGLGTSNRDLIYVDPSLAILLALLIFRDGVRSIRASLNPEFSGGCGCCTSASKKAEQYNTPESTDMGRGLLSSCNDPCCAEKTDVATVVDDKPCGAASLPTRQPLSIPSRSVAATTSNDKDTCCKTGKLTSSSPLPTLLSGGRSVLVLSNLVQPHVLTDDEAHEGKTISTACRTNKKQNLLKKSRKKSPDSVKSLA